jgi:hypothetical protein
MGAHGRLYVQPSRNCIPLAARMAARCKYAAQKRESPDNYHIVRAFEFRPPTTSYGKQRSSVADYITSVT